MVTSYSIQAEPRSLTGRQARSLRHQGVIPCNIYGPTTEPINIQIAQVDLKKVIKEVGTTAIITVNVGSTAYQCMVREVVRTPDQQHFIHVDFFAPDQNTPVKAVVPVRFQGESALFVGGGVLITPQTQVTISCLPKDLPRHIDADLSKLVSFKDTITSAHLTAPAGVTIVTPATITLAYVSQSRAARAEK